MRKKINTDFTDFKIINLPKEINKKNSGGRLIAFMYNGKPKYMTVKEIKENLNKLETLETLETLLELLIQRGYEQKDCFMVNKDLYNQIKDLLEEKDENDR